MTTYSHSRISTYENCPYQYKLKYIDKIKPSYDNGIEAFMGGIVHEVLERLYKDHKIGKCSSKTELFNLYNKLWEEKFSDRILIARKGTFPEEYRKMGMRFIRDYYNKFHPFDQLKVIGIETEDKMVLKDGSEWHVRIDKLCCDGEGNYYVCDYKTNNRMKEQKEADSDRQLAMYSIWVKDNFNDVKSVKLVWHMLKFDETIMSERNEEQLNDLHNEIVSKIENLKRAEEENNFPPNVSKLCEWCLYQDICQEYRKAKNVWERQDTL